MRSDSRRRIVAKLLAEAEISKEIDSRAESGDEVPPSVISPEFILGTPFVGPATVGFLAGDVRSLDLEGSDPSVSAPALVIFPTRVQHESEGPTFSKLAGVQQFCVIVSPEIASRLQRLGIHDVADHLRGKHLLVSGTVERQLQEAPLYGVVYSIGVNSLDQLVRIRKPVEEE